MKRDIAFQCLNIRKSFKIQWCLFLPRVGAEIPAKHSLNTVGGNLKLDRQVNMHPFCFSNSASKIHLTVISVHAQRYMHTDVYCNVSCNKGGKTLKIQLEKWLKNLGHYLWCKISCCFKKID